VHVELDFADGLWPVAVDPGELELVVLNLALNARDAMPSGGVIRISAENAPGVNGGGGHDYVRLCVVDNGVGMSEEVMAHVFEPFYTTKDVGRGSGLGLAQVHGFVTQSGGRVEIESEIGRGASVTILLPRSQEPPAHTERHLVDLHVEMQSRGDLGCVLLVEDDDEVAALVTEMLEQLGYQVTRTSSAMAALGALSNGRRVDLVFSDIMMPGGMNGVELAREVRRRRGDLPVLLTSGFAEAARESAAAEGVRVLAKPYRLEELAAALDTVITTH
jgi:CheY-like chemotaxis protein